MTLTVTDSAEDYAVRLRAAGRDEMLAMLRDASHAEALIAVQTLGLRELYELPRDIVEQWDGDARTAGTARFLRAQRLTSELWVPADTPRDQIAGRWRIADIAHAANVRTDSVGRWRTNTNNGVLDWKRCLPHNTGEIGNVKKPGERKGQRGGSGIPLFEPSIILDWLKRSKKITDDLYPHLRRRGGGIPTGRPPKPRVPDDE